MRKKLAVLTSVISTVVVLASSSVTGVQALSPGEVGPWTTSSNSLPGITSAPGFTSYNGYGYVLGGFNNNPWSDQVYFTKLNSDGSVDAWTTNADPLPHVLGYPSAVAYNDRLYVLGGYGSGFQDTVYYANINNDGSLSNWVTNSNSLPEGLYESAVVADNNYLYLFGGTSGNTGIGTSAIYTAPLNPDGSVGSWSASSSTLPTPLRRTAFAYNNGYVYLAGGDNNSSARTSSVYYAKLNSDGSIGTWATSSNSLPVATSGAGGIAAGGFFYVIGGNITNSSTRTNAVYYAAFNDDGSLGSWTLNANSLPAARQHPAVFTANSYLYVAGGQNGAAQNSVFSAFAEPAAAPAPDPDPAVSTSSDPATTLADTGQSQQAIVYLAGLLILGGGGLLARLANRKLA